MCWKERIIYETKKNGKEGSGGNDDGSGAVFYWSASGVCRGGTD